MNKYTGRTRNLSNRELKQDIEVDFITGGQIMVINRQVIVDGILPNPRLFFGFEELDFCLRAKRHNYQIKIDGTKWLEDRQRANNQNAKYRWRGRSIGKPELLWRQYYSTRNMLNILIRNHLYIAFVYTFVKLPFKILWGFRYGFQYGAQYLITQVKAVYHFTKGRYDQLNFN